MSERALVGHLAIRVVLGLAGWLSPTGAARLVGLDPQRETAVGWTGRLYATRELVIGGAIATAGAEARPGLLHWASAMNVADAVVLGAAGLRGRLPAAAAVPSVALALVSAGLARRAASRT